MPELETSQAIAVEVPAVPPPAEPLSAIEPIPEPALEPHPLEPGGKRFEQVWARAKTAEEKLQEEREARIRAEERLSVLETVKATKKAEDDAAKVHSWETLEGWITEGRITRAQANEYREGVVAEKAARDAEARLSKHMDATQRRRDVTSGIAQYQAAVPSLKDRTSPERLRAEAEYAYLVNLHGAPKDEDQRLVYELNACHSAFGDVAALAKLKATQDVTQANREAFVETTQTGKPTTATDENAIPPEVAKDPRLLAHYQRMMDNGRYPGGWKDVKAELAFRPPRT